MQESFLTCHPPQPFPLAQEDPLEQTPNKVSNHESKKCPQVEATQSYFLRHRDTVGQETLFKTQAGLVIIRRNALNLVNMPNLASV